MLELLAESDDTLIALKVSGILTIADQHAMLPKLEAMLEQHDLAFRVLLDLRDLTEMEKGVKSDSLWFDMRYRSRVERIAYVCDDTWHDEVVRAADIFKAADVKRFHPDKHAAALSWLRDD